MDWNVPEYVWLPKLIRYAHFTSFIMEDENSIQLFLDGCPTLKIFKLVIRVSLEDETQVKTLCMSSFSLKFLKINWEEIDHDRK